VNIYETIGLAWIIFTALLATVAIGYFAYKGASDAWRQRQRGATEEALDIRRSGDANYLDRRGVSSVRAAV